MEGRTAIECSLPEMVESPPLTPANSFMPSSPKTPRKPSHPRRAVDRELVNGSTVFRFEMVQDATADTPHLKIRAQTLGESLLRAKRRLWVNECDPVGSEIVKKLRLDVPFDTDEEFDGASLPTDPSCGSPNLPSPQYEAVSVQIPNPAKVKTCASCKTKKTPLWRDSEDGTPYCNACGIRYKKYRIRCSNCLYIPRKDEKLGNCCCLCGQRLVHCRVGGR